MCIRDSIIILPDFDRHSELVHDLGVLPVFEPVFDFLPTDRIWQDFFGRIDDSESLVLNFIEFMSRNQMRFHWNVDVAFLRLKNVIRSSRLQRESFPDSDRS